MSINPSDDTSIHTYFAIDTFVRSSPPNFMTKRNFILHLSVQLTVLHSMVLFLILINSGGDGNGAAGLFPLIIYSKGHVVWKQKYLCHTLVEWLSLGHFFLRPLIFILSVLLRSHSHDTLSIGYKVLPLGSICLSVCQTARFPICLSFHS